MTLDRSLKIVAWLYVAGLVAFTLVHVNWQAAIGNPFNIYRAVALAFAGMLARIAYPAAPSFAFLMMIGSVCTLSLAHFAVTGSYGYPLDIITDMAGALWGVVLGAAFNRQRLPTGTRNMLP